MSVPDGCGNKCLQTRGHQAVPIYPRLALEVESLLWTSWAGSFCEPQEGMHLLPFAGPGGAYRLWCPCSGPCTPCSKLTTPILASAKRSPPIRHLPMSFRQAGF